MKIDSATIDWCVDQLHTLVGERKAARKHAGNDYIIACAATLRLRADQALTDAYDLASDTSTR